MTSLLTSEVILNDKDYRKSTSKFFQKYTISKLEDLLFWDAINIDFENQTKENCGVINGNTWNIIKMYCIPRGVQIDYPKNNNTQAEILVNIILTKYNKYFRDWNIDYIVQVEKIYDIISKTIQLQKQELLRNDARFWTLL